MKPNFKGNKRRIQEAKNKKRQEKLEKKLKEKSANNTDTKEA